jgi:hypothetical protein
MVDEVALGQAFLRQLRDFLDQNHSGSVPRWYFISVPPTLYNLRGLQITRFPSPEDGDRKLIPNAGNYLSISTGSYPRRPDSFLTPL